MSKDSRWVATFLTTRRVARRRELSRQIIVLSMAVGLSVFAIVGWAVANRNRSIRAGFDVGASRVLTVQVRPGVSLLDAVRRADPRGRWAMAAVVERAADGTLLAVDASRLANVASWPPGFGGATLATIAHRLSPPTAPPVILSGGALRVAADIPSSVAAAAELEATIFDDAYQTTSTLDLGSLQRGEHDYTASMRGGCSDSCRLVNLGVAWTPSGSNPSQTTAVHLMIASVSVEGNGTWQPVDAGLSTPARWQSDSSEVRINRDASGRLSVVATVDADGAAASFEPADAPNALPAVTTGDQVGGTNQTLLAVGLDGSTIDIRSVVQASTLPRVGPGASMVDLALAERSQTGPMLDTTSEVWLSHTAPRLIVRMLHSDGVSVIDDQSVSAQDAVLGSGGMSLAYTAFLLAAAVAALLAVGSTAMAGVAIGRRRKAELAAMAIVGLDRRVLRRWLIGEQSLIVFTGMVLGVAAGAVGAAVALRSVPEFVGLGPAPPLDFSLPLGILTLCLTFLMVALSATIVIIASGIIRSVTWEDLGGEDS